jgi:replication-associated recombination protein RarA
MTNREPGPTPDGHPFDLAASALQKAIRRCDEEAAVYWALQLEGAGYGPYVWYRLAVITSEDVGLAGDVALPATIEALHRWYELHRKRNAGQARIFVAHAALLLARSPKSGVVGNAYVAIEGEGRRDVPDVAKDKHTKMGRALGRGEDFFWDCSSWYADPETGELTPEGAIPDPYRDRARNASKAS